MLPTILNFSQKKSFIDDGYLVIPNFIDESICHHLMERANFLIDNFNPDDVKIIFSTKNPRHIKHQYFLNSGADIRFFFEEKALDENGELIKEKLKSINKIGHALHDLDPVFNMFSRQHKIALLANELGLQNPLLLQSMYICKQPRIGGEVNCHQDGTYLHSEKNSVIGLWFALEDATQENGCLWAIPGGHKTSLKSRFLRSCNDETYTQTLDETPWDLSTMVPLEVKRGSVIVLHTQLPHMSKENISEKSRHAYTLHMMSGDDVFSKENWLQRPAEKPFT